MGTIQLQSVGRVPAVPVSKLKKGDKVMFNFGYVSRVKNIKKITKASYEITWLTSEGKTVAVKKRGTTLMARMPFK